VSSKETAVSVLIQYKSNCASSVMTQNQALHSHHASTKTTEGQEHNFSGDVQKGKANKFIYMSVIYTEILLQTGREIELNTDNIINLSELRICKQLRI
jgi:hypothetical protein